MKKKLLALLLAVAMVVSLVGCGSKKVEEPAPTTDGTQTTDTKDTETETPAEPEAVTLRIWAPENQIQSGTIDSMTASFQALHPEWKIEFTVEAQGEDTLKDVVLQDVTAAADVFFFASDQLAELVNAGAIAKLGGSTEELVKTTMPQAVIDTVTVDGSIYAIPFTHNTYFMYYDKTLLTEDDIKSVEGIMAKETPENVYNFCFDSAGGWKLGAWYYGAGNTIYGESQTDFAAGCDWNNEKGIKVTNYLIDLINNPKTAYSDDVSLSELSADHRIGAWFDGSWNYDLYKTALGDDLGLAVIPTFNPDGTSYQLKGFYGSKAIGVNAQAAFPAVAVAFAAYIGGEEMQVQRFAETGQVPTNIAAGESEAVQANDIAKVIVAEVQVASVKQPTTSEFNSRYWSNAGAIAGEIKSGALNKDNVQEKMDVFVESMKVQ